VKAVIMEIHKDYCIVMTKDGRFLKRKIPAGVFEIGDEITVDLEMSFEPVATPRRSMIGRYLATAMVVLVIVVGAVLGERFIRQYYESKGIERVGFEEAAEEAVEEAAEEEAEEPQYEYEEASEAAEDEEEVLAEAGKEGNVVYRDIYFLDTEDWAQEKIMGIMFSYRVESGAVLQVQIENISNEPAFDGTFELFMLEADKSETRLINIPFRNFVPGDFFEDSFLLQEGEASFRLEVFEEF
jgi:hypothetical protein